ncbi:M20 family metallopeptidase [Acanthopleuribacter pedis]|uniref:M20 family metallopeptidase n=1 Tax=Acanthopleuribacter pedis TaxID=442870 RepID=A0A8J7Q1X5_9BACT|nr:M20 family metallopeptidase [Acanthopleuribacter pedis]MBO1318967.1 M20 family metallopeptidase [Acanthopleuribacter pedis]
MVDSKETESFINAFWDSDIVPTLIEYIKIPNKSPAFDPDWEANGHMEEAYQLAKKWIEDHPIEGMILHEGRLPGRTPLLLLDIPGDTDNTILLYGHLDKQPEMTGWREGLGPWIPVMEEGKLYGRGGADDGYALFASMAALMAARRQGVKLPRAVVMIEFSEESGSPDLPAYVDHFAKEIGEVDLVVCLDSGAGNYDQLWSTTSLRGLVGGTVRVDVLNEGVHSGDASGVVASSFRVLRQLFARLEDAETGKVLPEELQAEIPAQRMDQARQVAAELGEEVYTKFPFVDGMQPMSDDTVTCILNRTWRAALSYTGLDGMPSTQAGGNVLRPYTTWKLSLRLPPTLNGEEAQKAVERILSENPPYNAKVTCHFEESATGWNAPPLADWLGEALDEVSQTFYGKPALHMGEGGSIPFMGMLGEKFPKAQFVVTGVLGPNSNAHGPNEFLHVPYAKKLTCCVAHILAIHAKVRG